jgi:hypothetical protein
VAKIIILQICYIYTQPMHSVKSKVFLFLLAGIPVFLLAGIMLLHFVLPGRVAGSLQKEVARMLEGEAAGLYQVVIPEATFSPLFRTMYIPAVSLVPDTQALAGREPALLPPAIFNIQVGGLEVSTGGLASLARKKDNIVFSSVRLKEFSVTVIRNPAGELPEKEGSSGPFQSFEIKNFALAFTGLKVQMLEALGSDVFSLGHGEFSSGFLWQADEGQDEGPNTGPDEGPNTGPDEGPGATKFDLREPAFWAAGLDIRPVGGLHRFACDSLVLGGDGGRLELYGIQVIPLFNKRQFRNQVTHQTDRFEANLDTVRFSGFDPNKLINQKYLSAEQLEVSNGRLEVFRDRHPPLNTFQRPLMPVRRIMQAPFQMRLGTTRINDLDVFYQELPEGSAEEGVIPFRNLSASLTNVTNAGEHLMHDSIMRIETRARVFGRANLTASFVYNLQDIHGGYRAHGTLTAMPFETINPALIPLTGIQVLEGAHEHTSFHFTGNDFRSDGTLTMRYSGLRMDMAPDRGRLRQAITNWVGRQFVYYPSNPGSNGEVRQGTIAFAREPDRFVFHYWWNCFLTGAGSTVMRDRAN